MSEERRRSVLDEFGPKRLRKQPFSLLKDSAVSARCAVGPDAFVERKAEALPGCCEFAVGEIEGLDGRRCVDNTYCPKRIFGDAQVFVLCPGRDEKLKAKAEKKLREQPRI